MYPEGKTKCERPFAPCPWSLAKGSWKTELMISSRKQGTGHLDTPTQVSAEFAQKEAKRSHCSASRSSLHFMA